MSTSTTTLQHPHLQELLDRSANLSAEVEALKARSDAELTWKPGPKSWSMIECIDHLNATAGLYHSRLRDAIAQAPRSNTDAPFKPTFFGRRFLKAVSPQGNLRLKTMGPFKPTPAAQADRAILDRFLDLHREYTEILRSADGVNLNDSKFASPLTRLMRFTVGEGLSMLTYHGERHLQQARRVAEHPAFPAE